MFGPIGKRGEVMDLELYLKNVIIKEAKSERESWDDYFKRLAKLIAERSTCVHRKVGALIVKDKRILATGYNQPPSGFPHCDQIGCIRDDLDIPSGRNQEICYGLHAEQNALMQAANWDFNRGCHNLRDSQAVFCLRTPL